MDIGRQAAALAALRQGLEGVTTFDELGTRVVPKLGRWLGAVAWSLYHSTEAAPQAVVATNIPSSIEAYQREWYRSDPLTVQLLRPYPESIFPVSRLPVWASHMRRHPIYAEFAPAQGVQHLMFMRLNGIGYLRPGSASIVYFRSPGDRDFDGEDVLALAQILPALQAAERRCARVVRAQAVVPVLEALLDETSPGARLLFDVGGRLAWCSPSARRLLSPAVGPAGRVPEPLRRLAQNVLAGEPPRAGVSLALGGRTRIVASARRIAGGHALVELRSEGDEAGVAALRARYNLTLAEAQVLAEIGAGRSNAEIARRRRVSLATVRTQVTRILEKLEVHTRVEAALIAVRHTGH